MKTLIVAIALGLGSAPAQKNLPEPISTAAAAKAKLSLRIIQNAGEADLIEGNFDPFTAGLLDGLTQDLEDDMSNLRLRGDRDLASMLYSDLGWLEDYRVGGLPKPLRSEVMHWVFDCTHEINVALRNSVVPSNGGACEFTEAKWKALHPSVKDPAK